MACGPALFLSDHNDNNTRAQDARFHAEPGRERGQQRHGARGRGTVLLEGHGQFHLRIKDCLIRRGRVSIEKGTGNWPSALIMPCTRARFQHAYSFPPLGIAFLPSTHQKVLCADLLEPGLVVHHWVQVVPPSPPVAAAGAGPRGGVFLVVALVPAEVGVGDVPGPVVVWMCVGLGGSVRALKMAVAP